MGGYTELKAAIAAVIKTNGNNEITGAILQNVLNTIVSTVGANRAFAGIADAKTNPGTPDGNVFYVAYTAGNYVSFVSGSTYITVNPGELAILYNSTANWGKYVIGLSANGVYSLLDAVNQINATGSFSYNDTPALGSNANSLRVRTFLVAGQRYQFTLTTVGGNALANIQGIKADGTFATIRGITGTPAGVTVNITPTENYYGFTIYYGTGTTATSVNVLFETQAGESDGLPDALGDANNFYPDPFIEAGADIAALPGVQSILVAGTPQYYADRIVLPVGAFLGVILDLSQFPYTPATDYLNALMKVDAPGTGQKLGVAFDPKTSGSFSSSVALTIDPQYDGWLSFYNVTGCSTISNRCRVTFDNRGGTQPLTIYRCMLWTGQNVAPFGMFAKQAWNAWKKVKDIPIKTINYAPYYNVFNLQGSAMNVVRTRTTLSYTVNNAGTTAFIGYDFNLADSPFEIGDVIGYGADNVVVSNATTAVMYCIFYNDSTEISRLALQLSAGGFCTYSGTIPENTTRILIRFQIRGVGAAISVGDNYLTKGEINKSSEWERQSIKHETTVNTTTAAVVYVDAVNGNDTNPGTTESTALATFAAAFSKTGVDTTIILIGDTTERFNIKTKSNQRSVRLIGKQGLVNRIICGTKIDSGTLVAGTTNVYQTPLSSFLNADRFQLFQHEVFDESTLIPDNERHPLQRGKTYRCDSTKITRVTSLDDVKASEGYTFFYDKDAQMLYVKIKEGTTLATNPVYIPDGSGISGNDGSVAFEMVNIECWYGSISLRFCHGGRAIDCAAKYAFGGGAWSWEAAIGVELIRCEATRAFSGSSTGDGFNAHSTTAGSALAKHTVATMIDCWSHDNNDDGYSDHERCETTIIGGLFEYNVKAGLTPAFGCQDTIYNAYCRKQVNNGIALVGGATAAEGGRGSQIFVIGCICENNKTNFYVSGDKSVNDENFGKFVNCISLNGTQYGYLCGNNARVELNNCTDSGSPTAKSGNIVVNNAALVE